MLCYNMVAYLSKALWYMCIKRYTLGLFERVWTETGAQLNSSAHDWRLPFEKWESFGRRLIKKSRTWMVFTSLNVNDGIIAWIFHMKLCHARRVARKKNTTGLGYIFLVSLINNESPNYHKNEVSWGWLSCTGKTADPFLQRGVVWDGCPQHP